MSSKLNITIIAHQANVAQHGSVLDNDPIVSAAMTEVTRLGMPSGFRLLTQTALRKVAPHINLTLSSETFYDCAGDVLKGPGKPTDRTAALARVGSYALGQHLRSSKYLKDALSDLEHHLHFAPAGQRFSNVLKRLPQMLRFVKIIAETINALPNDPTQAQSVRQRTMYSLTTADSNMHSSEI